MSLSRSVSAFLVMIILLIVATRPIPIELVVPQISASGTGPPSFSFGAAGDHNMSTTTEQSLALLAKANVSFYLALGDLSYQRSSDDISWCGLVRSYLGPDFPFELVSGNHDQSHINGFLGCLPDRIGGIVGDYGFQYYFDYPESAPLARIILISPGLVLSFNGQTTNHTYARDTPDYTWLSTAIDSARDRGIQWVIVGMHEVCISAGVMSCQIGTDLTNLLTVKKVDLVLQAHDHNYQRSKQLTCAVPGEFQAACVADNGQNGTYTQGLGTIFVIAGTFGASEECCRINYNDPDAGYFVKLMGWNTPGNGYGFVKYDVSSATLHGETVFNGTFNDNFTIRGRPDGNSRTPNPANPFVPSSGQPNISLVLIAASLSGAMAIGSIFYVRRRGRVTKSATFFYRRLFLCWP